jgi:hypothetical protein
MSDKKTVFRAKELRAELAGVRAEALFRAEMLQALSQFKMSAENGVPEKLREEVNRRLATN